MNLKLFSSTGIIFLNILIQKFERREYKTKVQVKCESLENGKIFEFLWSQGYCQVSNLLAGNGGRGGDAEISM